MKSNHKISKYKIKIYIENSKNKDAEPIIIPLHFQKLLKIADGDY